MKTYNYGDLMQLVAKWKLRTLGLVTKGTPYEGAAYLVFVYNPIQHMFGTSVYNSNSYRDAMRFFKSKYNIAEKIIVKDVWKEFDIFIIKRD